MTAPGWTNSFSVDLRGVRMWLEPDKEAYTSIMAGTSSVEVSQAAAAATTVLAAAADPVRWTVLTRLAESPRCVCDLQEHVPVAANLLSYHLKVLREAGLVTTSRRGRWIDYALADDALARLHAALPGALVGAPS